MVDGIIKEPEGGAHADPASAVALVREAVEEHLKELLAGPSGASLVEERFRKFSAMGRFDPRKSVVRS